MKTSYSSQIKKQLIVSDIKSKCCAEAELTALLLMHEEDVFQSEDKNFIRRINALALKAKDMNVKRRVFTNIDKKGKKHYGIELKSNKMKEFPEIEEKFCCSNAFLKGCFIYSGYISSPESPARAEISFKNATPAEFCKKQLHQCGISYNTTIRNSKEVIYIKSVASVSDFLAHIGAIGAMLEFENRNIIKKGNSDANRMMNCDNANLDKTVAAAAKQTALISEFMKTSTFDTLPEQLKEIAILRVENESLSLKELGMLLTPMLSKSGVAHRLKKIEEIASKKIFF